MAFQVVPKTASVKFFVTDGSLDFIQTLYVISDAPWVGARLTDLLDVAQDWWTTELADVVSSNFGLREIVARDEGAENGNSQTRVLSPMVLGALAGDPLPYQVAYAVTLRTASAGRNARGRTYHYGLTESVVSGNTVSATYRNDVTNRYEQWLVKLQAQVDMAPVVVSRFDGVVQVQKTKPVKRNQGVTFVITEVTTSNDMVDSQRRRSPQQ